MKLTSEDLRESKIFMYWRTVKKWAAEYWKMTAPDVEMIMSLHCKKRFTRDGFEDGEKVMAWDTTRFARLRKEGWIDVYRQFTRAGGKTIFKPSRKANEMVNKIYRILLGEEEIPMNNKNPFWKADTYTDKVMLSSIDDMKRDYKEDKAVYGND